MLDGAMLTFEPVVQTPRSTTPASPNQNADDSPSGGQFVDATSPVPASADAPTVTYENGQTRGVIVSVDGDDESNLSGELTSDDAPPINTIDLNSPKKPMRRAAEPQSDTPVLAPDAFQDAFNALGQDLSVDYASGIHGLNPYARSDMCTHVLTPIYSCSVRCSCMFVHSLCCTSSHGVLTHTVLSFSNITFAGDTQGSGARSSSADDLRRLLRVTRTQWQRERDFSFKKDGNFNCCFVKGIQLHVSYGDADRWHTCQWIIDFA